MNFGYSLILLFCITACDTPKNKPADSLFPGTETFDESQKTGEVFVIDTTLKNKNVNHNN
jgi:hypothetical protein